MTTPVPNEPPESAPATARSNVRALPTANRVMPSDLQMEASLLGSMLMSRDAVLTGLEMCTAEDFYRPAHGHIFAAMKALFSTGQPIDTLTVRDQLARDGTLAEVEALDGAVTLMSLTTTVPSLTNAHRYAQVVIDTRRMRDLICAAGEIAELGYALPEDVQAAVDTAESILFRVSDRRRRQAIVRLGDTLSEWLDDLEDQVDGEVAGVPTGFQDLDQLLLGQRGGQLIVVAGRTGMGKSAYLLALASAAGKLGFTVYLVSLEMSRKELDDRYVAAEARVDMQNIRRAKIAEKDWPRIAQAVGRLSDLPIHIETDAGATVLSIRAGARRLASRGPLGIIMVDYLQLIDPGRKVRGGDRQEVVAEISRGLKRLALDLGVPVVAAAQLNRGVEGRKDKRPSLADLRESGAIENDADVVQLLYREDYYDKASHDAGVMEIDVAKQRNGPTDRVRVQYEAAYGRFSDLSQRKEF